MSAWRLLLKRACDLGGGPHRRLSIDAGLGIDSRSAAEDLRRWGLIERVTGRTFRVTQAGWDVYAGRADMQRMPGAKHYVLRPVIGASVPDELIERLLVAAGLEPGGRVTPDLIRTYSDSLVAAARIALPPRGAA